MLRNQSRSLFFSFDDFCYGAYLILFFLILTGCSNQTPHQWEIDKILTKTPCFNGGRLILGPDSDCSHLEIELIRNTSGIRMYVNLLFLRAPSWPEDPTRTTLTIQFEEQEPWIIHPYLLEGGQRMLLSEDIADFLIQSLCDGHSFNIQIGRSQIHVVPNQFIKLYKELLELLVEE